MIADVALVTERRYERPAIVDEYVGNILEEDRLVAEALARRGLHCARVDWSRTDLDFAAFRCLVLRTTWDYFDRFAAFSRWLDAIEDRVTVFNDLATVRWNLDKHYLADLGARGVPTIPTEFVESEDDRALADILHARGWDEVVIKPAVSGAARHTHRVTRAAAPGFDAFLRERRNEGAMLVQPFLPDVLAHGETTIVVIDGRCTHAVRKIGKPGDFRVQDDHGGTVHAYTPRADELALARAAVEACERPPLYARVDMVRDRDDRPALMELELVEPELFVRACPEAADALAAGLVARLNAGSDP
jgi:glutathione synthase/RimK-type ligase-like ATP-grasp enzyme